MFYRRVWQGWNSQHDKGAHILGARSPWRLNFVPWRLKSVNPQYGTCFISPSWRLKFWGGSKIFRKSVHSRSKTMAVYDNYDRCDTDNSGIHELLSNDTWHKVDRQATTFRRNLSRSSPCSWRLQTTLNTKLLGITYQKTVISTLSAMRFSNLQM